MFFLWVGGHGEFMMSVKTWTMHVKHSTKCLGFVIWLDFGTCEWEKGEKNNYFG